MKTILAIALLASALTTAYADQTVKPSTDPKAAIDKLLESLSADSPAPPPVAHADVPPERDPRWQVVPKERRLDIIFWCYGMAGGNAAGDVPDYAKQADCIDRQLDGYARVHALQPPLEN